jgi:hypothetical protein
MLRARSHARRRRRRRKEDATAALIAWPRLAASAEGVARGSWARPRDFDRRLELPAAADGASQRRGATRSSTATSAGWGRRAPLAYALTVDPPLELTVGEEHIGVPTSDELLMEGKVTAEGERVRLELELSWSPAPSKV